MTALLLDVGNSRLKWGVLADGEIHRTGHVSHAAVQKEGLAALITKLPRRFDEVMISNVAGPTFGTRLTGVLRAQFDCEIRFARPERRAYGVTNGYRQPRKLGVDRWVALVAARSELRQACLIVDAGTAVTLDAMDDAGRHLGGQIIPGVRLMASALGAETAGIAVSTRRLEDAAADLSVFGSDTGNAVRNGGWNALVGAVERARRILEHAGLSPVLVVTGGDAPRMLPAFEGDTLQRPHLVLQGLAQMTIRRQ